MRQKVFLFLVLAWFIFETPRVVLAADINASDVIAGVNALRASQGLAPYQEDGWLMGYAQQHSEYQASINTSTHTHSDGVLPWSIGIQENIAAGTAGYISVDFIVNLIWSDALHMKTMVGYTSGFVGMGVASSGGITYITLDVRPGNNPATLPAGQGALGVTLPTSTPRPFVPIVTSTPLPDGRIVHIVAEGDTLWSIAVSYGVKMDDIRRLNNLPAGFTAIRIGQKLVIRLAAATATGQTGTPTGQLATDTQTVTATFTRLPPSQTLSPTPSLTATLTRQPSVTQTPLPQVSTGFNTRVVGIALVIFCAIGLLVVGFTGFRKR